MDGRRKWTAAEKLRIVLEGMHGGIEVAELCRREGINPTRILSVAAAIEGVGREDLRRQGGRPSAGM